MRIVVVGGGVVGSAAAFFAARKGAEVCLLDAAEGTASHVPSALINPVRGQNGKVAPDAVLGMALTWQLVETLTEAGHVIPHDRTGVLRPVPDEATYRRWAAQLPPALPHHWLAPPDVRELAPGWHAVLELPEAGWLDGAAFTGALQAASRAEVVREWATEVSAHRVRLASGTELRADRVVWCGGSIGASRCRMNVQHRGGSLFTFDRRLSARPLSFGVYAAPCLGGGVLGATFEAPTELFNAAPPPAASVEWLRERTVKLLGKRPWNPCGIWSGSRLSTRVAGLQPDGSWALAGLGSKGFLLGPLLAQSLINNPQFWPNP